MHRQTVQRKQENIARKASLLRAVVFAHNSKQAFYQPMCRKDSISMKFTATQQQFHRGLALVGHAVPARPILPIQSRVLATLDGERLRLSATSEDMGIHCWIEAEEIVEPGRTLLPARLISDLVGNLPASPVTITAPAPQDATSCCVTCERVSAQIKNAGEDPEEFPAMASYEQGGERLLLLDTALLKEIIGQVAFAAAENDNRPALTGLFISIREGEAVFAASDAFRLAVRTIALPDDQLHRDVLVPARTLSVLAKLLPPHTVVEAILPCGEKQLLFHMDGLDLSTRLLSETYPDIRSVLPQEYTTRAVLRTQELAAATRLMVPFAQAHHNAVHLSIPGQEPNTVMIEAEAPDLGRNAQVLCAQVEGPDQRIVLNIGYLADVLAVIQEEEVALELPTPLRRVAVKPVGPTGYIYVMVPMSDPRAAAAQAQHAAQDRTNPAAVVA
jgi:DNA polymerase-3 subunit beta